MNLTDKDIFRLVDEFDIDEFEEIMGDTLVKDIVVDDLTKKRIEAGVFKKLGNTFEEAKSKKTMKNKIIAASIASALIISSFQLLPNSVLAEIRARLQFIPGIGKVVEKEGEENLYILDKTIKTPYKSGEIIIKSVIKKGESIELVINGERLNWILGEHIKIKNGNGSFYESKGYSIGGVRTGTWEGYYSFKGDLRKDNLLTIVIEDELEIPITLVEAKSFENYSSIGATDKKNGVAITAVSSKEDDSIKINLIYPPLEGKEIISFAKVYRDLKIQYDMKVTDDKGNVYELKYPSAYRKALSEFTFKGNNDAEYYNLKIPFIELEYKDKANVEVDIPSDGKLQINKQFSIAGFKVEITNVERLDKNNIRIYVDTFYDRNKVESLKSIVLDSSKLPMRGYMTHFSDDESIEYFEFEIKPSMKNITLSFIEAETELQGPWEVKIENTID